MNLPSAFRRHWSKDIQLSRFQLQAIASAILSRSPGCRLLVFGLGNDTGLWLEVNGAGETCFLETSPEWIETVKARHPGLQVGLMPNFGLTVATSMGADEAALQACTIPAALRSARWDVILVDAPTGFAADQPGRAVAIYWALQLADRSTHVFVDDYERPLEGRFSDKYLKRRNTNSAVITASESLPSRKLFWSMGDPLGRDAASARNG
ncbi:hypothetical protein [Siccirubricoccus phaeus]|uniref:hypothetical protein n=1 Tax=Siccirubricoccus phaeus TaxID=2595053 RepID=UPI0011F21B0D|nr:hypothetical protein [Siccirubricoccus phaeus]